MSKREAPTTIDAFLALPIWDGSKPVGCVYMSERCILHAADGRYVWWKLVGDSEGNYWREKE